MEPSNLKIGEKLKSVRSARALSLDEAATLTGVSKPMPGQIERRQSNVILGDNGKRRAYPLFVCDPVRSVETFYFEFDPGCSHSSDKVRQLAIRPGEQHCPLLSGMAEG